MLSLLYGYHSVAARMGPRRVPLGTVNMTTVVLAVVHPVRTTVRIALWPVRVVVRVLVPWPVRVPVRVLRAVV